jgi:hypothetical protein
MQFTFQVWQFTFELFNWFSFQLDLVHFSSVIGSLFKFGSQVKNYLSTNCSSSDKIYPRVDGYLLLRLVFNDSRKL